MNAMSPAERWLAIAYGAALLPLACATLWQWAIGAGPGTEAIVAVVWSALVATLLAGGQLGARIVAEPGPAWRGHALVALITFTLALAAPLLAVGASYLSLPGLLWGLAAAAAAHLVQWRSLTGWGRLPAYWQKHQSRFVWGALGCHLLIGLNVLGALRGL